MWSVRIRSMHCSLKTHCCRSAQEESVFDIIPGDVVSSNILAAAAAMTQVLCGLCAMS